MDLVETTKSTSEKPATTTARKSVQPGIEVAKESTAASHASSVAARKEALEAKRAAMVQEQLAEQLEKKEEKEASTTEAIQAAPRDLLQQLPYDCDGDTEAWEISWSKGKKDWCCRHRQRGCQRSDASVPNWGGDRTSW
jgi:hypothetical protein